MQEIKIPDGHKATILGGTIWIEPIEKVQEPKFKRGDILIHEDSLFIIIFDHTEYRTGGERHIAFCSEKLETVGYPPYYNGELYDSGCGCTKEYRLATPEEQQILFDALAKEGKYWDAEALEVKDIPKEEIIKNIFRELRGCNLSVNEAYRRMHKLIPINN